MPEIIKDENGNDDDVVISYKFSEEEFEKEFLRKEKRDSLLSKLEIVALTTIVAAQIAIIVCTTWLLCFGITH